MKPIGLIGGTSWESSLEYYRLLNRMTAERLGQPHSAELIMYSMDFAKLDGLRKLDRWDMIETMIVGYAEQLKAAGAGFLLLCANTLHKIADEVEAGGGLPLLHIADVTAAEIKRNGLDRIGLLGTRITMEERFYSGRFQERHGITAIIPDEPDRMEIDRIIFNELTRSEFRESSREFFRGVIGSLVGRGARGIVLGCMEIPLLVRQEDSPVPVFDTMKLHAAAAVERALG